MDGYAFSSCDLARLAAEASGLSLSEDAGLPSEERIRQNIIQVTFQPVRGSLSAARPSKPLLRLPSLVVHVVTALRWWLSTYT
jgi:hypothetical protein